MNIELSDTLKSPALRAALTTVITRLTQCPDFDYARFQSNQLKVVEDILLAYENGIKNYILEAPTGIGKSIIAVAVIETLRIKNGWSYKTAPQPTGYIITSSKVLQEQIDKDKERFLLDWMVLKGQANYTCAINNAPFPKRDCIDMTLAQAEGQLPCAQQCEYIQRRRKAIEMDCAILSYAYWLTSMNYVTEKLGTIAPFQKREIIVFDEAHCAQDIVSQMFQLELNPYLLNTLAQIIDLCIQNGATEAENEEHNNARTQIANLYAAIGDPANSMAQCFTLLCTLREILLLFINNINLHINKYFPKNEKLFSAAQRRLCITLEKIHNFFYTVDFFVAENKDQIQYIVKQTGADEIITFRTLMEAGLMKTHVHKYTHFCLWMSATIGDATIFAANNGIENYRYSYMDSNFHFKNSEIYTVTPPISLAYKNKIQTLPELIKRIFYICETLHPAERGIIHTGNFEIANRLAAAIHNGETYVNNPYRYMFYKTSEDKEYILKKLSQTPDGILIGPSLTEGLDLADDLARFCIVAKTPYPNIDDFVKAKMNLFPEWYGWKTTMTFLQSIGRCIRHKDDHAKTYLMDACFELLLAKNRVPPFVRRRMTTLNVGMLQAAETTKEAEECGLFNFLIPGNNVQIAATI